MSQTELKRSRTDRPLRRWILDPGTRPAEAWALLGCVGLHLTLSLATFNQMDGDAFIYYRPGVNIAKGFGYAFNRGGGPIETGSTWVWQMLVVVLATLPLPLWLSATP